MQTQILAQILSYFSCLYVPSEFVLENKLLNFLDVALVASISRVISSTRSYRGYLASCYLFNIIPCPYLNSIQVPISRVIISISRNNKKLTQKLSLGFWKSGLMFINLHYIGEAFISGQNVLSSIQLFKPGQFFFSNL